MSLGSLLVELRKLGADTEIKKSNLGMYAGSPEPAQDAWDSESQDIGDECCICLSQSPTVLFLPCGHGACCRPCYDRMLNGLHHGLDRITCPLCRRDVQTVEHLSPDQIREISHGTESDELRTDFSDPIVDLQIQRVRAGRERLLREAQQRGEAGDFLANHERLLRDALFGQNFRQRVYERTGGRRRRDRPADVEQFASLPMPNDEEEDVYDYSLFDDNAPVSNWQSERVDDDDYDYGDDYDDYDDAHSAGPRFRHDDYDPNFIHRSHSDTRERVRNQQEASRLERQSEAHQQRLERRLVEMRHEAVRRGHDEEGPAAQGRRSRHGH